MSNTGLKINYSVRPAKNMERKMMKDVFSRLFVFDELSEYQYVGFGSKYFTDFILFHRSLNIRKMVSIECDRHNQDRYHFNKPYDFIEMNFGQSSGCLPQLKYDKRSIIWLDYDDSFNESMLSDLILLVKKLKSGSLLSLSFASEVPDIEKLKVDYSNIIENYYKRYFEEIFGNIGIELDDRGWNRNNRFTNFINEKIYNRLLAGIDLRNSNLNGNEKFVLEQVFYFTYADGRPMTTIGWILFSENERDKFDNLNLKKFNFYVNEIDKPYKIDDCQLTMKEVHLLMAKMPLNEQDDLSIDTKIIPEKMQREFAKNYQYFPSFYEIEAY